MNKPVKMQDQEGNTNIDVTTDRILARIGQLTRALRDSMRELGLDKNIERAAEVMPDARDRLRYIASMTEQAAERVLGAVDVARPVQDRLLDDTAALNTRWAHWNAALIGPDDAQALFEDTRAFLLRVPESAAATNAQLLEIMMAQDFQDLTGQVIRKIMAIIDLIEQQLLGVLIENIKEDRREAFAAQAAELVTPDPLLNGPQVKPDGKNDVMQGQAQVDDLLASLGF